MQLVRHNLTKSTSDQEPVKTDEPVTTEASSALEQAAEPPVETAEDEVADKAEEPNTDDIMAEELAALDPTKRRLELWYQSTSRKLMFQVLPNRVCSIAARAYRSPVCERGASGRDVPKSHHSVTLLEHGKPVLGADRRFVNIHSLTSKETEVKMLVLSCGIVVLRPARSLRAAQA